MCWPPPHGPARRLCRAEPAPGAGGPALERGRAGQPGAADPGAEPRAAEGHQPGLRPGANGDGTGDSSGVGADTARAYAERRGLAPASEIVVRDRPTEAARAASARPRRSVFAGLKLDARPTAEAAPSRPVSPAPADQGNEADQLARSVATYARAWADAERMRQAGLPVLPHQTEALARANRALDEQLRGFGRDLDAALTRIPALAEGAGTDTAEWSGARLTTLIAAGRVERAPRERLEARARDTVRAWGRLEREYEQAGKKHDHTAQREIGGRMRQFATDLKRDTQVDNLLRLRGPQFGVAADSRLARVVREPSVEQMQSRLAQRHTQGPRLGR